MMQITKTFTAKFEVGDKVKVCGLFGLNDDKPNKTIVKVNFDVDDMVFKYLVEYEDGTRLWRSEFNLKHDTKAEEKEQ